MIWVRRLLIAALILVVTGYVGAQIFKKQIGTALFKSVSEARIGVDLSASLPDGLHIYMCGTGSPLPSDRAGPCMGILAGDRAFVFDIGDGSVSNLSRMGFPVGRVEALYLTHLHSDHIDGMGGLMLQAWVGGGRDTPLPIRGPVGTEIVVSGFNTAYRIDSTYRTAHHGPGIANPAGYGGVAEEITLPAGPSGQLVVLNEGDLKITVFPVDHSPVEPAFGYRIDYKDRSIVISGDTIYDERLVAAAEDADILFHEVLQPKMVLIMADAAEARGNTLISTIFHDILDYHTSPEDAAKAAQAAGVDRLVFYHIVPPLPTKWLYPAFMGAAKNNFDGKIIMGEDGMLISLPAESERFTFSEVL